MFCVHSTVTKTIAGYEALSEDRNEAIVAAYKSGGNSLKEVGDHFALHYSTVSGIIRYHKSKT